MDYPFWDVTIGGGLLMALVAIPHVIVSHFAIGGGLVIAVTETLAVRRKDRELRELARRSSFVLILISTVFGAISGVGIWVVAGLIAPAAISALIHTYVWGWAIEWAFFIVEIVAALVYYATWDKISKQAHLLVGWLYFVSAYLSLVIINGIITFMATPGSWLETGAFWDGFFNPTYWPSLTLRTGICLVMATAFLMFCARRAGEQARPRLLRYLGWWSVAGCLVSYAGYRWWEAALPETIRAMFAAASPLIPGLDVTRSLALWALTIVLVLAGGLLVAFPRAARLPVLVLIMGASFVFFGSYERLREAVRKPFLIHSHMFSNGLLVDRIGQLNREGLVATSGWVAAAFEQDPVRSGQQVFRAQCASCHTVDGYLSLRRRLPSYQDMLAIAAAPTTPAAVTVFRRECAACHPDSDAEEMREMLPSPDEMQDDPAMIRDFAAGMVEATLERLHALGDEYERLSPGTLAATASFDIPTMPPLVGTQQEQEALLAYLTSLTTPGEGSRGGEQ